MSAQLDLLTGEQAQDFVRAVLRGGPFDGERMQVPALEHDPTVAKPVWIRRWDKQGNVWWYVWKRNTKATYELLAGQE